MTGRERIEQAAKENGWARTVDSPRYAEYERDGYLAWIEYGRRGDITIAKFGASRVRALPKDKAGQVIAYLQQHKEQP